MLCKLRKPVMSITWVVEAEVFPRDAAELPCIAAELGGRAILWDDDWTEETLPALPGPVVFRGSLAIADRVARSPKWQPGAFCETTRLHCSAYFPLVSDLLVSERRAETTVAQLVRDASGIASTLGTNSGRLFVRPDSPLKPFSGRVVPIEGLTLASFDCGFYYDDPDLPVIASPVFAVHAEWRLVAIGRTVVAGCGYDPVTHSPTEVPVPDEVVQLGGEVAKRVHSTTPIVVIDIGRTDAGLRLVELNPFSGADLYKCDLAAVAASVQNWIDSDAAS